MNDYYVYVCKNSCGNIFYVGQGRGTRAYNKSHHRSLEFKKASKDGRTISFLKKGLTQIQAWNLEIATIRLYRGCGMSIVNKSSGGAYGGSGVRVSLETRAKMAAAKLGRPHTNKGRVSPNKGRKLSTDTKSKISKARKRLKHYKGKQVIDLINGYVYDSVIDASKAYLINVGTLKQYLNNKIKNKTNLRYVKDFPCL